MQIGRIHYVLQQLSVWEYSSLFYAVVDKCAVTCHFWGFDKGERITGGTLPFLNLHRILSSPFFPAPNPLTLS